VDTAFLECDESLIDEIRMEKSEIFAKDVMVMRGEE